MGIICGKRKQLDHDKFNNYHCKNCGEIPLINFSTFNFDIICSNHKILNIEYEQFYNFISFDYECSICKQQSNQNDLIYCYDYDKIFCNKCLNNYKQNKNDNDLNICKISDKNIICSLHNIKYDRFCLICKINLCQFCENSYNHYTELFKDIYPLEEDLRIFKNLSISLLKNIIRETNNYNGDDYDEILNNEKKNESIKIKLLFIESFSKNITNYFYIIIIFIILLDVFIIKILILKILDQIQNILII